MSWIRFGPRLVAGMMGILMCATSVIAADDSATDPASPTAVVENADARSPATEGDSNRDADSNDQISGIGDE